MSDSRPMVFSPQQLAELYAETDAVLVFPSEIISLSWARRIARIHGAVRLDRFCSWDSFKETVFFGQQTERPANRIFRSLFLTGLIAENAGEGFFRALIPPAYKSEGKLWKSTLLTLIPDLQRFISLKPAELGNLVGAELQSDILNLHERYRAFLTYHRRYEPGWIKPEFVSDGRSYVIVLPRLLEDFSSYSQQLMGQDEVVFLDQAQGSAYDTGIQTELRDFRDYRQELIWVLEEIRSSLLKGFHPAEITISLADFDAQYSRLEQYARAFDVPLVGRKGRPLIEYAQVGWLSAILRMSSEAYSFDSVREFLLHPGLPWKDGKKLRTLLYGAVDSGLIEGGFREWIRLADSKGPRHSRSSGESTGQMPGSGIFRHIQDILATGTIDQLVNALYRFLREYCDTDLWLPHEAAPWQRAVESARDLEAGLAELAEVRVNPLEMLVEQLESVNYLPQSDKAAVSVYDYRVGAGLDTKLHFCVGFSSDACNISAGGHAFLREKARRQIFPGSEELGTAFLRAYLQSGSRVCMSFSHQVPGSAALASAPFLEGESEHMAGVSEPPFLPPGLGGASKDEKDPTGLQSYSRSVLNLQRMVWDSPHEVLTPREISVSDLEAWVRCPWEYVWRRLRLEPLKIRPRLQPPELVGNAFHAILEELYRRIREHGDGNGLLIPERAGDYFELSQLILKRAFGLGASGFLEGIPRLIRPYLRQRFGKAIERILEEDLQRFPGYQVAEIEGRHLWPFIHNGQELALSGRIDRVLTHPETGDLALADFKTGKTPPVSRVLGRLNRELPRKEDQLEMGEDALYKYLASIEPQAESLQLPAYSLLATGAGGSIRYMGYYSLRRDKTGREGSYVPVMALEGDSAFPLKKNQAIPDLRLLEQLQKGVLNSLIQWAEHCRAGNFSSDEGHCVSCRSRGLCRHRFRLRMLSEE